MKKKDEIKVCLVGSSGGHLTHLYMLKPFWKDKDHFWVTFDKEDEQYKKTICSTALCFTIITSLIVFFIMILARNYIAQYFFSDRQYAYVAYLSAMATLVGATNSIIAASTRMQNKRKVFLVTNTLSPLLSYSISVPMLLAGHYVIALPIGCSDFRCNYGSGIWYYES
uniref:oligosaccharide flippase family protein n=1 Tax=Faecalibacterium prausnitzii TaxID=853 RepID=UPI0040294C29